MLLINLFILCCYLIMAQTTINYIKVFFAFKDWVQGKRVTLYCVINCYVIWLSN